MPRGGKILDLTGQKYGRLTALEMVERNSSNKIQWLCRCDCGNLTKVTTCHLRSGHTKGTRLYNIWCDMKKRCYNSHHHSYERYGGRGITVCDEWIHDFAAFRDWSMNNNYANNLTIDRINNNGNYEPGNCRWTTLKEQANNTSNCHIVTVDGVSKTISQWSEYLGINRSKIDSAYKQGKDLENYIRELLEQFKHRKE